MTYSEFVNAYLGKAIDYDGGYGVQCVDLIRLYLDKVYGITNVNGNAKDYFEKYDSKDSLKNNFDRISNTADFVPQKGDICVWGAELNQYGHVAIATGDGNTSNFTSYDMNWNGKEMKLVNHTYKGFLGVLRFKGNQESDGDIDMKTYQNGSTPEKVYSDTELTNQIGSLNAHESCDCFGIFNNRAMVRYQVDGSNNYKIGFVEWLGGVR